MKGLSQCMIVKNEEKHIRRALSWAAGIAKEQIVVDTGSTDRTVEIARSMGAKVFHFPWEDDFSSAKNYAIRQASGSWIAFLDADEYLDADDAKKAAGDLKEIVSGAHGRHHVRLDAVRQSGGVFCRCQPGTHFCQQKGSALPQKNP